jgi:putative hemolysin
LPLSHPFPWADVAVLLALIALNGFFSMSELAIVSARRARLQAMAKAGRAGAAVALRLGENPGRFLSTAQIGITLIGILAGAYSGETLGGPVGDRLAAAGMAPALAARLGFVIVIVGTTYVSLVIGELIPKQLALRSAERIAIVVAPVMALLARFTAPVAWLLDRSTRAVLALFGRPRTNNTVTAEEVQMVVAEATASGTIDEGERALISGVMRLAERTVRGIMTPRTEVEWLDASADAAETRARLLATAHTRLLVAEGTIEQILGVVEARDLLARLLGGEALDLRAAAKRAPVIPDVTDASDAIAVLQSGKVPMALVHDEYGHFEGIVTPSNLLAAIAGVFRADMDEGEDAFAVRREDGSWLISGAMPADEMAELLDVRLPEDRDFETVAGYVLAELRHFPECGEGFATGGWRFEVVDLDGHKIDKLLVARAG